MSWSALLKVTPHVRCVALPRAKGGILRNARGMDLVAVEALSHSEEPSLYTTRRMLPGSAYLLCGAPERQQWHQG
jgi:hypothetical protein